MSWVTHRDRSRVTRTDEDVLPFESTRCARRGYGRSAVHERPDGPCPPRPMLRVNAHLAGRSVVHARAASYRLPMWLSNLSSRLLGSAWKSQNELVNARYNLAVGWSSRLTTSRRREAVSRTKYSRSCTATTRKVTPR